MKRKLSKKFNIKEGVKDFFEDDELSKIDEEVSLKTLLTVFIIGLVIIATLYFYTYYQTENVVIDDEFLENITDEEINYYFDDEFSSDTINLSDAELEECFYRVNLKDHPENVIIGLINSSNITDGVAISLRTEIYVYTENLKNINRVIAEIRTNESQKIRFTIGDGDFFIDESFEPFFLKNSTEWQYMTINTTNLFEEDYKYLSFNTHNENM